MKLKERLNYFEHYSEWYSRIISDFGFNYKDDLRARDLLIEYFHEKTHWNLEEKLVEIQQMLHRKKEIIIYGCGPSLETTIHIIEKKNYLSKLRGVLNITADGASVFLRRKDIPIDIIFTDLDGITKSEFDGSQFVIVHGHGDNINKLKTYRKVIIFKDDIIGTTQVNPKDDIINPGGFTDGDRIVFFLRALLQKKQKLYFIGMDFQEMVGKFSKPYLTKNTKADEIKSKKLHYAVELLEWIQERIPNEMIFVNSPEFSEDFKFIGINEFLDEVTF